MTDPLSTAHLAAFDGVLEINAPALDTLELEAAYDELRFGLGLLDDAELVRAFTSVRAQAYDTADHRCRMAEAVTLSVLLERFAGERLAEAFAAAEERDERELDALIVRGDIAPEIADRFPEDWL